MKLRLRMALLAGALAAPAGCAGLDMATVVETGYAFAPIRGLAAFPETVRSC